MMTIGMVVQVLVRKGKANCAGTDDWGWSLLHEVRMINIARLTLMWMKIMVAMISMARM